jgi:hypothetical protein
MIRNLVEPSVMGYFTTLNSSLRLANSNRLQMTFVHARNLGAFVLLYKALLALVTRTPPFDHALLSSVTAQPPLSQCKL